MFCSILFCIFAPKYYYRTPFMVEQYHRTNISNAAEIAAASIVFLLGGCIYIAFRSTSLRMFGWFDYLGFHNIVMGIRSTSDNIQIPEIIKFCIPDGLWTLSYILFMDVIWSPDVRKQILFCGIIPIIGTISEILQLFGLVNGTFDVVDLLCYLIPYVLYITLKYRL